MRLSAKREDAFHWSGSEDSTFGMTKLIAALIVAGGSYYVFQLWAPNAPPVLKPQIVAREVQPPPPSVVNRSTLPTEQLQPQTQMRSQAEPESPPSAQQQIETSSATSHRSTTYLDLRDQFLSGLGQ